MIEIFQAHKSYQGKAALFDINLTIPTGGITSIIGPNGAGKSTLLSAIGRLMSLDQGSILVDGQNVDRVNTHELAKKLAILRQENRLSARLTVEELVSFGRYPHSKGRLTAKDKKYIDDALDFMGLHEFSNRFLDQLSGGQRQRAYVAMVLCQDTDYLLLDEPLNNLDIKRSVEMMKQIRRAADELNKTIVLVVHDINFAVAYSDQVIALQEGKVIYNGGVDELMHETILEQIFDTPIEINMVERQKFCMYYRVDRPCHPCSCK